jgi:hypothetical protein
MPGGTSGSKYFGLDDDADRSFYARQKIIGDRKKDIDEGRRGRT